MSCGIPGASGHVTTKPSIRKRGMLYKSRVHALNATCLTPERPARCRHRKVWLGYCDTAGKPGGNGEDEVQAEAPERLRAE